MATIGAFKLNTLSSAIATAYVPPFSATGGTIGYATISNVTYKTHTFTTVGSNTFVSNGSGLVDFLLVGGGGAGGGKGTVASAVGGGGAGARVINSTGYSVTNQSYVISIGAGGTGVSGAAGGTGGSSTAFGQTATGGTGGGVAGTTNGAGAGTSTTTSNTSTVGTYTYKGGNAYGSATAAQRAGGGGAGFTAAGVNASLGYGGDGGAGFTSNISGISQMYASGGGGGGSSPGSGRNADGTVALSATNGSGGSTTAGYPNTTGTYGGGGGGARTTTTTSAAGGNGRSGICIVRYPLASLTSLSFVAKQLSSQKSTTVTMPSTAQAGDVAFMFDIQYNSTTTIPTAVTPTGWTDITSSATNSTTYGSRICVSYKVLTGGEAGTTITGMVGGGLAGSYKVIYVYRGNVPITDVIITPATSQVTTGAPSSQTLTMTNEVGPFLGFALFGACDNSVLVRGHTGGASDGEDVLSNFFIMRRWEEGSNVVTFKTTATITEGNNGTVNSLVSFLAKVRAV